MNRERAEADLALVRHVLEATRERVDPQMFHFIIWGSIVLVWYPLDNWLRIQGAAGWQGPLAVTALVLGTLCSLLGGYRANVAPRLPAGNPHLASQIALICSAFVGTGVACTITASAIGAETRWMPHLWGLIYTLLLMVLGVCYSAECFWLGLLALGGTLAGAIYPMQAGYLIGGTMGPAAILAGLFAERRVRGLQQIRGHLLVPSLIVAAAIPV